MVQKTISIIELVSDLGQFTPYHGSILELLSTNHGDDKLFVIDNGAKGRAIYAILTVKGWIVFTRSYTDQDIVYPSVYGILISMMDIGDMSNAVSHGISIAQLNEICGDINI